MRLLLPALDALQVFILARDQAFVKALFFSAVRVSELVIVKIVQILRLPDNSGMLFNHLWTKTLRNGDSSIFAKRGAGMGWFYPVSGIEVYFKIAALLKIVLIPVQISDKGR